MPRYTVHLYCYQQLRFSVCSKWAFLLYFISNFFFPKCDHSKSVCLRFNRSLWPNGSNLSTSCGGSGSRMHTHLRHTSICSRCRNEPNCLINRRSSPVVLFFPSDSPSVFLSFPFTLSISISGHQRRPKFDVTPSPLRLFPPLFPSWK